MSPGSFRNKVSWFRIALILWDAVETGHHRQALPPGETEVISGVVAWMGGKTLSRNSSLSGSPKSDPRRKKVFVCKSFHEHGLWPLIKAG